MAYKTALSRLYSAMKLPIARGRGRQGNARGAAFVLASALLVPIAFLMNVFRASGQEVEGVHEWELAEFREPSGIVYHPIRETLFLVGDEGYLGEVSMKGELLKLKKLGGDLEAIACDPSTGNLYIVREGHEIIFEVRPDDFKILRRFTIDRAFDGDPDYLRRGGDGIEGLTFIPDAKHPEGGRFFAVNQYDPAVIVELAIPLKTSDEDFETARVLSARDVATAPLSGVTWDPEINGFLVISAIWRRVYLTDADGKYLRSVRVPGIMPEGIVPVPGRGYVIAQDSGGLVHWLPPKNPFLDTENGLP